MSSSEQSDGCSPENALSHLVLSITEQDGLDTELKLSALDVPE